MFKFLNIDLPNKRIFGLDLLRAFAILSLVLSHSVLLMPLNIAKYFSPFGFDGVTMFFVLSGFLIGKILIKSLQRFELDINFMINFWSRRWFRTFPAYFLCLIVLYFITIKFFPSALPDNILNYFLFLQNFASAQPEFFAESCSLAVEEWFYLIVPVFVFASIRFF